MTNPAETSTHRVWRGARAGALATAAIWLAAVMSAGAQPQPRPRPGPPPAPAPGTPPAESPAAKSDDSKDQKKDKKPPKPDRWFVVKGATVHTVSGPTLQGATIVCKNGKIHEIGRQARIPEKAEVLDATGYHVYPGLVAVRSLTVIGGEPPEDTTDVYSLQSAAALAGGLTTLVTQNTAAKVTFGTVEDISIRRNIFENVRFRANDPGGKRRLRAGFEKARAYLRDLRDHEQEKSRNPDAKAPDDKDVKSGDAALALRLMKGETTALVEADAMYDLIQICELAEEYGGKWVIRGATEAWTIAPRLARAGIACIVTPRTRQDPDPRLLRPNGGTIENAAILHDHGVQVAIIPSLPGVGFGGLGGRDLLQLNLEASFAVRGGLPEDFALRAITLDAARILGIDARVGSIQEGKDADFVIADGDMLHYMTMARWTVVNGQVMYDKQKDTLLAHIRPDGNPDPPPPDDVWPKRLGE
ncbi:MAG: amidohydrolase family protein [Phycisphaerales bacterium]